MYPRAIEDLVTQHFSQYYHSSLPLLFFWYEALLALAAQYDHCNGVSESHFTDVIFLR